MCFSVIVNLKIVALLLFTATFHNDTIHVIETFSCVCNLTHFPKQYIVLSSDRDRSLMTSIAGTA